MPFAFVTTGLLLLLTQTALLAQTTTVVTDRTALQADTLYGPKDLPNTVAIGTDLLEQYTGIYQADGDLRFSFQAKAGKLYGQVNGGQVALLVARSQSNFDILDEDGEELANLVFEKNQAGKVIQLKARKKDDSEWIRAEKK